jgi:hypothetical protein
MREDIQQGWQVLLKQETCYAPKTSQSQKSKKIKAENQ